MSRLSLRTGLGLFVFAALLAGCSGEGDASTPSPSATPEASAPTVTATASPTATPTAVATPEVQHTVWLINLWDEALYTIYQHPDAPPGRTAFVASHLAGVEAASGPGVFDAEGHPVSFPGFQCEAGATGVVVQGVEYPDVPTCGPASPDERYMLFEVPTPEVSPPASEQWVLDLDAGEARLLQQGLIGCGGCDGRFAPEWWPGGRYVYFAETVQEGRVFLSDVETGETRVVATGTDVWYRPSWSYSEEPLLLVRGGAESAVLVHALNGEATTLPIAWPAAFDPSGTLAYSPTAGPPSASPDAGPTVTSVLNIKTLEITELEGTPPSWYLRWGVHAVSAMGSRFIAVLESPDCDGTVLHLPDVPPACIEGARGAVPARNGTAVAFALLVPGEERVVQGTEFSRYDIAVLDVTTGEIDVVAEGAYSGELPPRIQWSEFGDLLLVTWPHVPGL